jgi:hypothetical protein
MERRALLASRRAPPARSSHEIEEWQMPREYSNHQKKIIKRFYDNREGIDSQRLSEIASDLYLPEGKKKERLWKQAAEIMERLNVPKSRIEHVLKTARPDILVEVINDLQKGLIRPAEKPKPAVPPPSEE